MSKRIREQKKGSPIRSFFFYILVVLLVLLALIGALAAASLAWLDSFWGGVNFATAIIQLRTPMGGVNTDMISIYLKDVAFPVVSAWGICVVALLLLVKAAKRTDTQIVIRIRNKLLSIGPRAFTILCIGVILFVSWAPFPSEAKKTGATDYLIQSMKKSTLYEQYYVPPTSENVTFPEKKRNLVMIYLESMETTYASTDVGGGKSKNYIPNLTNLALNNTFFSDSEQLGGCTQTNGTGWTMAGLLSSTSGVPFALPGDGNAMSQQSEFLPGITNLGDLLQDAGYHNYFVCGSDATFGGRRLYFTKHGNYTIQDYVFAKENRYIPEDYQVFWGMEDRKTFAMAQTELTKAASLGEPFNYTILTVDTHFPQGYTDPTDPLCTGDTVNDPYGSAISCSDARVSEFVKWIQQQSWYENTTVVIIGDHLSMNSTFWGDLPTDYNRHVFNCFINLPEGLRTDNTQNRLYFTEDYFPTVLAAIGVTIKDDRLGLGTNLFSGKKTLLEKIGVEEYNNLESQYSGYYVNKFEKVSSKKKS